MRNIIEKSWKNIIGGEFEKDYFKKLITFINSEYLNKIVYPEQNNIFRCFKLSPFNKTKVIIIGQDPYYGPKQANGLCFSVQRGIKIPPSLKNIYIELKNDINICGFSSGDLSAWGKQGVLLLNSTLTVLEGKPGSHQNKGWEEFSDMVIKTISDKKENVVFLLWGSFAHKKNSLINEKKHLVLKAPHPSPLSSYRGFFGSKHFSKTNKYLKKTNQKEIDWSI